LNAVARDDEEAARALANVLGDCHWEAAALARAFLSLLQNGDPEGAARIAYETGPLSLKRSREILYAVRADGSGFTPYLNLRKKTGSAENAITKLFPATITEQRFLELLDELRDRQPGVQYRDDRESGHTLSDFTICEHDFELPINVKTAGTRFERATDLVGLDPDDCVPIPAYKAHAAVEVLPNLIYVVSVDFQLIGKLEAFLSSRLSRDEAIVWDLLNRYSGSRVREAEDLFVFGTVRRYWHDLKTLAANTPFNVISARKAVRVLQTEPQRTPGIGLRAWGTGARAEVNVHVSIQTDMTPWREVSERIIARGLGDIIQAVNRKRVEEVFDPEI